jgi:hypothetical protein
MTRATKFGGVAGNGDALNCGIRQTNTGRGIAKGKLPEDFHKIRTAGDLSGLLFNWQALISKSQPHRAQRLLKEVWWKRSASNSSISLRRCLGPLSATSARAICALGQLDREHREGTRARGRLGEEEPHSSGCSLKLDNPTTVAFLFSS